MVWFQCEDCGENLKKPKLATHFRICSAYKVSCIDCGETFDQQSVQGHTQCITEAEKYGPKTNGKPTQTPNSKSEKPKPNSDVDINVGLSTRPPWFCSLCNTTTTSKQTLLSHAEGKKHRAKARAFNAQNQPKNDITETPVTDEPAPPKDTVESDEKNIKRKREEVEGENGQVVQNEGPVCKKIKWKKIIAKTLKSNDGVLKIKRLVKQVIKGLKGSAVDEDKNQLSDKIINQINSSSRFLVENKHVKLVSKE